ncbi:MAG: hypothetical protein NTX49_10375 [Chlamydiae bacterium]|nr:hypothetical protein [Chlamydiota bacterium]
MTAALGDYLGSSFDEIDAKHLELTKSVIPVIGKSRHVVIYGYEKCGYEGVCYKLRQAISEKKSPLLGCYNWNLDPKNIPIPGLPDRVVTIIDGHELTKSPHPIGYKSGLLTIVLENCKRTSRNEPIIPVLFCVIYSAKPKLFSAENAMKIDIDGEIKRSETGKELNLAYKLCYDPKLPHEIHSVAKETFIFVRTIGEYWHSISRLEDTGLRIDDTWHAALREASPKEEHPSDKHDWRAWFMDQYTKPV